MALDPAQVFKVMQCAYRHGVLDKFMLIQGQALEGVMAEEGVNMGDLLNRMDEASEETVMKVDRLLDRAGPLLRYLDNERLMGAVSRLLDLAWVRRAMVEGMKRSIARTLSEAPPPTLGERLRSMAQRAF